MQTTMANTIKEKKGQKVVTKSNRPSEDDYISSEQFFKLLREEVNRHYENL